MILKIDFESEVPIYIQIRNQVVQGVAKRELIEGEELPSVRGLADDIGVNMHTVNKAYSLLKDEGYIKIGRRKGAFISLNLQVSDQKTKEELDYNLQYYMAECYNRGISCEEIKEQIEKLYSSFGGGDL